MPSVAMNVGANRIVAGAAIAAPLGLPDEGPEHERRFRRQLVTRALELLAEKVEAQTLVPRAS
jgi:glycine/betaine/sarcosine/D-proline reductase family selenoprotein B